MKKRSIGIAIFLICILGVAGSLYKINYDNYYKTHFKKGTELYSTDLSRKTIDEALNTPIRGAFLTIYHKDEKINVAFGDLIELDKTKMEQFLKTDEFNIKLNHDKLSERIKSLNLNKNSTNTEDAKIEKINNEFVIVDEVYGDKIDETKLIDSAIKIIESNNKLEIKSSEFVDEPKVKKDSKILSEKFDNLKSMETASISIKINDDEIPIEQSVIKNSVSTEGLRTDRLKEWLSNENDKYKTLNTNIKFKTHNNKELVMWNGTSVGWEINIDETLEKIKEVFNDTNKIKDKQVIDSSIIGDKQENVFGGNYAEVDLNEQRAYIFKDGKEIFSWNVITGLPNPQNMTNVGIHQIMYKQSPSVLRGFNNDGSRYESPVNYWIPFNAEGEGFHDANWQYYGFGGDKYKTLGSHGCVNTSPNDMPKVWELTYTGMPVIVWGDIYN